MAQKAGSTNSFSSSHISIDPFDKKRSSRIKKSAPVAEAGHDNFGRSKLNSNVDGVGQHITEERQSVSLAEVVAYSEHTSSYLFPNLFVNGRALFIWSSYMCAASVTGNKVGLDDDVIIKMGSFSAKIGRSLFKLGEKNVIEITCEKMETRLYINSIPIT